MRAGLGERNKIGQPDGFVEVVGDKEKKLAIAGGPLDKGWLLLQAFALRGSTTAQVSSLRRARARAVSEIGCVMACREKSFYRGGIPHARLRL